MTVHFLTLILSLVLWVATGHSKPDAASQAASLLLLGHAQL